MSRPMNEEKGEPNLTPILDMVFQLITFFMLVINFKGAEADLSLQLPVLGSARPLDTQGQEGLLVLNVDAEGRLKVYGHIQEVKQYVAAEARLETDRIKARNKKFKEGDELPTTVVIRADKVTPFKLLHDIIETCQEHGYRKFALKAVNKRDGGGSS
jgi:biopolymer transport protein ExbD